MPAESVMAEDEYVAATIATIGSLISKPKMTEKYLKKPPFRLGPSFNDAKVQRSLLSTRMAACYPFWRFLHDIVMEVTKTTTFSQGLFSPEECDSGNLSDKQAKLDFLNKAISVTCFALGESIDVSAPWFLKFLTPQKRV